MEILKWFAPLAAMAGGVLGALLFLFVLVTVVTVIMYAVEVVCDCVLYACKPSYEWVDRLAVIGAIGLVVMLIGCICMGYTWSPFFMRAAPICLIAGFIMFTLGLVPIFSTYFDDY